MASFVRTLSGPAVEPVTIAEARLWCRIDDDDATQDAILMLLIIAARERAEEITGRSFASRQMELRLDAFPEGDMAIDLPYSPVSAVSSITYRTSDGDSVLAGSPQAFQADTGSTPGRVMPLVGQSWPSTDGSLGAVRISYTSGYANTTAMPKLLRVFMMAFISTLYENREQFVMNNTVEIPRDFGAGLLDNLRVRVGWA